MITEVQDAVERYETARKEVHGTWNYGDVVNFVTATLKEQGQSIPSHKIHNLVSKALLVPPPQDKETDASVEVDNTTELVDRIGTKISRWEERFTNKIVSKTAKIANSLKGVFQLQGWTIPGVEEYEFLTSKNVYHKAVNFVNEFLSNYDMPGRADVKFNRMRNSAYVGGSVDKEVTAGDITLDVQFLTLSGMRVNAELTIPIRDGQFIEPSTLFIDGNSRVIAQSTFDDVARKGRVVRQMTKNPEDILTPDMVKRYQEFELPVVSTGMYSASKQIMEKVGTRLDERIDNTDSELEVLLVVQDGLEKYEEKRANIGALWSYDDASAFVITELKDRNLDGYVNKVGKLLSKAMLVTNEDTHIELKKTSGRLTEYLDNYRFEITNKEELNEALLEMMDEFSIDYMEVAELAEFEYEQGGIDEKLYKDILDVLGVQKKTSEVIQKEEKKVCSEEVDGEKKCSDEKELNRRDRLGDVIKVESENEYRTALSEVEKLISLDPEPETKEGKRLDFLANLVEKYEKKNFPITSEEKESSKKHAEVSDEIMDDVIKNFKKITGQDISTIFDFYQEESEGFFFQDELDKSYPKIREYIQDTYGIDIEKDEDFLYKFDDKLGLVFDTVYKPKEKESGYISEDRTEGRPPTEDSLAGGSSEELNDAIVGDKEETEKSFEYGELVYDKDGNEWEVGKNTIYGKWYHEVVSGKTIELQDSEANKLFKRGAIVGDKEYRKPHLSPEKIGQLIYASLVKDSNKEDLIVSKETLSNTINEIVESGSTKELLKWIGLAGGKKKLEDILGAFAETYEVDFPDAFFDLLDEASKEWRAVPESSYVGPKPWGGRRSSHESKTRI